jgi:hypothetical protein
MLESQCVQAMKLPSVACFGGLWPIDRFEETNRKRVPMRCTVCQSLTREHGLECQIEAVAVMQQRRWMILPAPSEPFDEMCQETVLASRKRQVRIMSRMECHMALAHSA